MMCLHFHCSTLASLLLSLLTSAPSCLWVKTKSSCLLWGNYVSDSKIKHPISVKEGKWHFLQLLFSFLLSGGADQKRRISQGGRLFRIHREALRQDGWDRSGVWNHHWLWQCEQNASHSHSERPWLYEANQGRGTTSRHSIFTCVRAAQVNSRAVLLSQHRKTEKTEQPW